MKKKSTWGKIWYFIWEDNSPLSWLVNVVLAFILIKFLVYPGLGFALGTSHPVVAVVSSSMEHDAGFDEWWAEKEVSYAEFNITREEFEDFPLRNGFDKGDIIVLRSPQTIKVGDIIVFQGSQPEPIIHRTVLLWEQEERHFYATKGDNNQGHVEDELRIRQEQVIGKAWIRLPLLGYVKLLFTGAVEQLQG